MSINVKQIFVTLNLCQIFHLILVPFPVFTLLSILLLQFQSIFGLHSLQSFRHWFFQLCLVLQFRLKIGQLNL